ncbi:MAG: hypothetical protein WED05_10065 [Candidatus Atabeyarchaeum deiterrae]
MSADVRFGYDKVYFSISVEEHGKFEFDREAYNLYKHRAVRIKPGNEWGLEWGWTNDNDHNTLKEVLGLQSRTMYVWANLMRLFMEEHSLMPPDASFDDNVCPVNTQFTPLEFHELLKRTIAVAQTHYEKAYEKVFKEKPPHTIVNIHQLEVVGEKINATVCDVYQPLLFMATARSFMKFHNETGTFYLNAWGQGKSQIKFYQKNPSILRQEITLNGRDASDLSNDIDDIRTTIAIANRVLERFNIPWFPTMATHSLRFDERLAAWAAFLKLDQAVLKGLLEATSWKATKSLQNLTRSLVRRKLLKKVHKGKYAPTYYLQEISRLILQEPTEEEPT